MVWYCQHGHTKEQHPQCYVKWMSEQKAPQVTLTGNSNLTDIEKPTETKHKIFNHVGTIKKSSTGITLKLMIFGKEDIKKIYYCYTLDMEAYLEGRRNSVRIFERIENQW